jgi:hypothetical protein
MALLSLAFPAFLAQAQVFWLSCLSHPNILKNKCFMVFYGSGSGFWLRFLSHPNILKNNGFMALFGSLAQWLKNFYRPP